MQLEKCYDHVNTATVYTFVTIYTKKIFEVQKNLFLYWSSLSSATLVTKQFLRSYYVLVQFRYTLNTLFILLLNLASNQLFKPNFKSSGLLFGLKL